MSSVTEEAGKKSRASGSRSRGGCNTCRYAGYETSIGMIYPTTVMLHAKSLSHWEYDNENIISSMFGWQQVHSIVGCMAVFNAEQ